jgi:lysophospholipase L1-like esterase
MRRRSAGSLLAVVLVTVVLSSCDLGVGRLEVGASPPASRPSPTAFGEGSTTWHLVAMGDSISAGEHCPGCTTYVDRYAAALARDAGVEVVRTNWSIRGLTAARLLELMRRDAALGSDVARADVVTLTIGVNDMPWNPGPDVCHAASAPGHVEWTRITSACVRTASRRYAGLLGSLLDQIAGLRAGKPTMVRLTGFYDDWAGRSGVAPDELATVARGVRLFDRAERRVAAAHGGLIADLLHTFNGPSGRDDAGSLLEPNHGVHPNQPGHDLIARALLQLGLAPIRA